MSERIEAAAVKRGESVISVRRPRRHHDAIRAAVELCRWEPPVLSEEQGFLTSLGRFVTRAEAEPIARTAGQIAGDLIGSVLTSEDLW